MRAVHVVGVDKSAGLRSDQTIVLQGPKTSLQYPVPLRRISYHDADTNKRFVFLTNNFQLPALTIRSFTSAAGKWNYSSSGSSKTCASRLSTAPRRTRSDAGVDLDQRVCPRGDLEEGTRAGTAV